MLFLMANSNKRYQDHQKSAINFGVLFDDTVTPLEALNDWGSVLPKAIAFCTARKDKVITTGQARGIKSNRLYAATLYSYKNKRSYGNAASLMTLSELNLYLSSPKSNDDTIPKFGESGYFCAGVNRSVTYLMSENIVPYVYGTYNVGTQFSSTASQSASVYETTVIRPYNYTAQGLVPSDLGNVTFPTTADTPVSTTSGYVSIGSAPGGPYFGSIDSGYSDSRNGRNRQGQFYSLPASYYSGNGFAGQVVQNADRDLKISGPFSGANTNLIPTWLGAMIEFAGEKTLLVFLIGDDQDIRLTSAVTPGEQITLEDNYQTVGYIDRIAC